MIDPEPLIGRIHPVAARLMDRMHDAAARDDVAGMAEAALPLFSADELNRLDRAVVRERRVREVVFRLESSEHELHHGSFWRVHDAAADNPGDSIKAEALARYLHPIGEQR